jgi:SAM-dependent methyltransferase
MGASQEERRGGAAYRAALTSYLSRHVGLYQGLVVDVGCGQRPYEPLIRSNPAVERYLGVDISVAGYVGADVLWDGSRLPLADGVAGGVLLTEVLEHCPEPMTVVRECARVLAPGGCVLGSVPFVWPLHDSPYDEYRYTPFALERILTGAGLTGVRISALGGWDASLAQVISLWAHRRPMSPSQRRLALAAARPVVGWLQRRDAPPVEHRDNVLTPGWFIQAEKAST